MKVLTVILRIILSLLLISPILGALGIFPPPTADLYNTPQAFSFIEALYSAQYINYIIALVFAISVVLIVKNKMAAVALLIAPITVNIVAFHLFLDGGLFTAGALLADLLLIINVYFLWQHREKYKILLAR